MAEERIAPGQVGDHNIPEYKEHIARYKFASTFIKDGMLRLDIACGTGYGTDILYKCGAEAFCGVDISKDAIQYAADNYHNDRIKFIQANACKTGLPVGSFDIVVSFETIEHMKKEDGEAFIAHISGLLKKDGLLILSCPNRDTYPENYTKNPYHIYEYSFSEILALVSARFKNIDIYCQKIRYFKRKFKKMAQLSHHLPKFIIAYLLSAAKKRYDAVKNLKKVNPFLRIILYEYYFGNEVFPFVEDYEAFKPVFLVFVCNK